MPGERNDKVGLFIATQQVINIHDFQQKQAENECIRDIHQEFSKHNVHDTPSQTDIDAWWGTLETIQKQLVKANQKSAEFFKQNQDFMFM